MTDQPCTRCGAPAEPAAVPTCSLCAYQLGKGMDATVEARGMAWGLAGVVALLGVSTDVSKHWENAPTYPQPDARVDGKCTLVLPTRWGLSRCLAPATRETENGDRCCEKCWQDRGCR